MWGRLRRWDLATLSCAAATGPVFSLVGLAVVGAMAFRFTEWHALHPGAGRAARVLDLAERALNAAWLVPFATFGLTALLAIALALAALSRGQHRSTAIAGLVLGMVELSGWALWLSVAAVVPGGGLVD